MASPSAAPALGAAHFSENGAEDEVGDGLGKGDSLDALPPFEECVPKCNVDEEPQSAPDEVQEDKPAKREGGKEGDSGDRKVGRKTVANDFHISALFDGSPGIPPAEKS